MIIDINSLQDNFIIDNYYEDLIKSIINKIGFEENINKDYEVSVTITDDNYIKNLNKEYRNIDKSTDVLSFPMFDNYKTWENISKEDSLLGDVVISIDKVIEQAKEYEHSINRELAFLVCHGIYHLLGYDHVEKNEEEIMLKKQENILEKFDLS
ncbi:MAG: rRNA maturation RNase YbeY [Clostridiales bacterium]